MLVITAFVNEVKNEKVVAFFARRMPSAMDEVNTRVQKYIDVEEVMVSHNEGLRGDKKRNDGPNSKD